VFEESVLINEEVSHLSKVCL